MKIEFADLEDWVEIKELLAECQLPSEDIRPDQLKHFLICRAKRQIIGVIGLEIYGNAALLRSLAVRAPYRGQGLARELVKQAERHALSDDVKKLFLLTNTAELFFAKQGYERVDRKLAPEALQNTTEFKTLCPMTAVCMLKALR